MVSRPPISPATRPMGRPRFRLMPHCMPGTMASTITAFMPVRTMVLLIRLGRDRPHHSVMKHSSMKNRPIITLGMPSLSTSHSLNSSSTASTTRAMAV